MGKLVSTHGINPTLQNAATDALKQWVNSFPAGSHCTSLECKLEHEVRTSLAAIPPGGTTKMCTNNPSPPPIKINCLDNRLNSQSFTYCFWEEHVSGGWAPKKIDLSPDVVWPATSPGIAATAIVEIKVISTTTNCMNFLNGTSGQSHKFGMPPSFSTKTPPLLINTPIDTVNQYYSELAEGQLWMDILRLSQFAKATSPAPEIYLLLFSDNTNTNEMANLQRTLNDFDTRYPYLYHSYYGKTRRSDTITFDYNFNPIHLSGRSEHAYLVRIV